MILWAFSPGSSCSKKHQYTSDQRTQSMQVTIKVALRCVAVMPPARHARQGKAWPRRDCEFRSCVSLSLSTRPYA